MSEHTLPDDLSQWPDDPYQLLGVQPGADERAIKKAYTRLIRRFKPEQAPDHFRRIRDAYEQAKRWLQWNMPASHGDGEGSPTFEIPANIDIEDFIAALKSRGQNGDEADEASTAEASVGPGRKPPAEVVQLREACQKARDGEVAAAYESLQEVTSAPACGDEGYARLYWLLRLWPQLEPGRPACEWLVEGMLAHGLRGRLCELYCEHLEHDASEAFTRRCTTLLTHQGSPWARLNLVRARWRAAALQDRWHYVEEDIELLRPLYDDAYEVWARVLVSACEILAWSTNHASLGAAQRCRVELEQHFGHSADLHDDLDRLDMLDEMVRSCYRLYETNQVSRELISLVRYSWLFPFYQLRSRIQAVLLPLVAEPLDGLAMLDLMHSVSPVAVIRLADMIEWLLADAPWEEQPMTDEQRQSLMRLLLAHGSNYGSLRDRLLQWCTAEAISPQQVIEFLRLQSADSALDGLTQDASLHYLWMAHTAMWA